MKFDLHVHTNYSDGKFSPREVIELAMKKNLNGIAITDHDTVLGLDEAIKYRKRFSKFKIIAGIELGCIYKNEEVHILGYGINYKYNELLDITTSLRINRIKRKKRIIDKLKKLNININLEDVQKLNKNNFTGRAHIAKILVEKGYANSISDAFEKYLNKGAVAYVPRKTLTIKEAVKLINKSSGIAVLAHPGLLKEKENIINYCIESGIQGIECIHSKHSKLEINKFKKIARKNNLLITGGSDCHGEMFDNSLLLGKFFVGKKEVFHMEELICKKNKKLFL